MQNGSGKATNDNSHKICLFIVAWRLIPRKINLRRYWLGREITNNVKVSLNELTILSTLLDCLMILCTVVELNDKLS